MNKQLWNAKEFVSSELKEINIQKEIDKSIYRKRYTIYLWKENLQFTISHFIIK